MEKTKQPIWAKILKIFGICLGGVVALILVALLCVHLFTPLVYNGFFFDAEKEYKVPGLMDGVVPQGYDYVEEDISFLMCGYMSDGVSASRIYITPEFFPEESRYVELYTADGQPYLGHTGGLTHKNGRLYMANDGDEAAGDNLVWVMDLREVLTAENGAKITLEQSFKPESRAAFCLADKDYLFVGEFRDPEKYLTVESHWFDVSGGKNYAVICAYPYDSTSPDGLLRDAEGKLVPAFALSIGDLVQGMTRTEDGSFVLSGSYGLSSSHLRFYENVLLGQPDDTLWVGNDGVPVYFLDSEALTEDITMPPMSEELVYKDGKVYVLFESACKKYIFGNFTRGRHIYSFE